MKLATELCRAVCVVSLVAGCAAPSAVGKRTAQAPGTDEAKVAALPAANEEERGIEERLREVVTYLAVNVGERHAQKSWNLAEATDGLARRLEKMGYEVRRHGFAVGEDVVQNLEVVVPGKERGDETVVVGAHFDTAAGSPGADDDASGVAAVLELARQFHGRKLSRSVRFVFFANGAPPNFRTSAAGSLSYAKGLLSSGARVTAMLNISGIGFYSADAGTQRQPESGKSAYPSAGSFLAVLGSSRSKDLVQYVTQTLGKELPLPVVADPAAEVVSDDWAFDEAGVPTVSVTDTGLLRNPHYRTATDLPDTLDFDRMARVVRALSTLVEGLGTSLPGGSQTQRLPVPGSQP